MNKRRLEKKLLKKEIENMMIELGMDKSKIGMGKRSFLKRLPKVVGKGYEYTIDVKGHRMSLRQRAAYFRELLVAHRNMQEEIKKQMQEVEKEKKQKEATFKIGE